MRDAKLKPLLHEGEFWILLLLSLPGVVATVLDLIDGKHPDTNSLLALPIVVYLGVGRQVARNGAAHGYGLQLASEAGIGDLDAEGEGEVDRLRDVVALKPLDRQLLEAADAEAERGELVDHGDK